MKLTTVKAREAYYSLQRQKRHAQTAKIESLLSEGGHSHRHIATECGCSEKTVQRRLRAMEARTEAS